MAGVSLTRHPRKGKSQKQGPDQWLPEDGVGLSLEKGTRGSSRGDETALCLDRADRHVVVRVAKTWKARGFLIHSCKVRCFQERLLEL